MKTFFNILQTIVDVKDKKYPDEPFRTSNESIDEIKSHVFYLIGHIFFAEKKEVEFVSQPYRTAKAKFSYLNKIIDNLFYQKQLKEKIISIFSKAQKCYFGFSKLARIYKIKKYSFVVTEDLSMNALNLNHKNTFMLLDNKSKYLFSINDLVSIIETSIGNAPEFFSDPLVSLNPYNKQPFTISTLYNIYFKLKESGRLMSVLFHCFFLENFCLFKFSEHHEHCIRENAIKKYIFNSPYTTLYHCVFDMLEEHPYTINYKIHKNFPKETLVNIFRPYLFYYYIVNYDIKGTNKITIYKQLLYAKLKQFYCYNKAFGREYIQTTTNFGKIVKKEYKFNTNYINFYGVKCNTANTNHYTFTNANNTNNTNNTINANNSNIFNTNVANVANADDSSSSISNSFDDHDEVDSIS